MKLKKSDHVKKGDHVVCVHYKNEPKCRVTGIFENQLPLTKQLDTRSILGILPGQPCNSTSDLTIEELQRRYREQCKEQHALRVSESLKATGITNVWDEGSITMVEQHGYVRVIEDHEYSILNKG